MHADSHVVEALTCHAHREKLRLIGRQDHLDALDRQALRLAREAAKASGAHHAGNVCNTIGSPEGSYSYVHGPSGLAYPPGGPGCLEPASTMEDTAVPQCRRQATLIVTGRGFGWGERRAWYAVKSALPGVWLEGTDFRGVLLARTEGEPLELAAHITSCCADAIGRVVPVLAEVESELDAIRKAAAEIGSQHVGVGESFCLRVHRRGWAGLEATGRDLERDVAEAVWSALERRNGAPPVVDLQDPDVTVVAEVFGPITRIGVCRKAWRSSPCDDSG